MIPTHDITGLILAGGRGSRMGGADKGLQPWHGQPLAQHALQRLTPQVGTTLISANRNTEQYATMGPVVLSDTLSGYEGPLAGFLTGLEHCTTPYLVTVPCDCPNFPSDLVAQLAKALTQHQAEIAVAVSRDEGTLRAHPVFCLMKASLRNSLAAFMQAGERRVSAWTAQHIRVDVPFDDASAFVGANTLDELRRL